MTSTAIQAAESARLPAMSAATLELAVIAGDLSKLTPDQRLEYYGGVCQSMGLNPLTKPFMYVSLNNQLQLYASKNATDQIRSIHKVNMEIVSREVVGDVYVVTTRATTPDGRSDEATGAVSIANIKGESLANAYMKAETKSKRRVTLSLVGLGMLDESEIESIRDARYVQVDDAGELLDAPRSGQTSATQEKPAAPKAKQAPKSREPEVLKEDVDEATFNARMDELKRVAAANGLDIRTEVAQLCEDNFYHRSIKRMLPKHFRTLIDDLIPAAGQDKKARAADVIDTTAERINE